MRTNSMRAVAAVALLCVSGGLVFGQDTAREQEAKQIAILKSSAGREEKSEACRQLAQVGTAEAVPALAPLLADEALFFMARYALELIPDPAANDALRDALGRAKGLPLVGIVESLGVRRDEKAVGAIAALLKEPDPALAQAVTRALGTIGGEEAAKALTTALGGAQGPGLAAVCEGLFRCAEGFVVKGQNDKALEIYEAVLKLQQAPHQVKAGALRGVVLLRGKDGLPLLMEALRGQDAGQVQAAAKIALEVKDQELVKRLADELGKAPADRQVLIAALLGKRGDAAAMPALIALARAGEKAARVAALKAAAELGTAESVGPLVDLLKDAEPDVAQAALAALGGLRAAGTDEAVIKLLESSDPVMKSRMIELVGQRRIIKAKPDLLKMMEDTNSDLRAAAIRSYGDLAGLGDLPGLLDRLVKNTNAGDIAALEKALGTVCATFEDQNAGVQKLVEALGRAVPEAQSVLLRTLRVAGGADALKAVQSAVASANADVHKTAVRVLSEWKTADAAPLLLELAKTSREQVDKVLSLRGYLGLAGIRKMPAEERLAICKQAAPLIERDDEKRMLLGTLGNLVNADALEMAARYLDDAGVRREAVATVMAIAEKRGRKQFTAVAKPALEKVVKVATDNPAVVTKAEEFLKKIGEEK